MEGISNQSSENIVEPVVNSTEPKIEKDYSVETESKPWNVIKNLIQVSVVALALNGMASGDSEAASGPKNVENNLKNNIENVKVVSFKEEQKLIELVAKNGKAGTVNINKTEYQVKKLETGKWNVEVGYSKEGGNAEWVIMESPDGSVSLLDNNTDGVVDRYVINNDNSPITGKPEIKSSTNLSYHFQNTERNDKYLGTNLASAMDVEMGNFNYQGNNVSFHSYDKEGNAFNDNSKLAGEFSHKMQTEFYTALKHTAEKYN